MLRWASSTCRQVGHSSRASQTFGLPSPVQESFESNGTMMLTKMESDEIRENSKIHFLYEHENLLTFCRYAWVIGFCIVGLMDIMATVMPGNVEPRSWDGLGFVSANVFADMIRWLGDHDVTISFMFSGMWFIDAFIDARRRYYGAVIAKERRIFMAKENKQQDAEQKEAWTREPTFVYYLTLAIQLLLLPVGFYMSLGYYIDQLASKERIQLLDNVDESFTISQFNSSGAQVYSKAFTVDSRLSLAFAIIQHVWVELTDMTIQTTRAKIRLMIKGAVPTAIKTIAGRAIRHPLVFRKRLRQVLTFFRWFKYLLPLVGTFNKLFGNIRDMKKKYKQRQKRLRQKRAKLKLVKIKDDTMRREKAAVMIQSSFRAQRSRRALFVIRTMQNAKLEGATLMVQRALRRALTRARVRLMRKKDELKELERIRRRRREALTDGQKQRMFELQDELGVQARDLLNRRLLMRPNTKFSVTWKFLFIACILLEISTLAMKPILDIYTTKKRQSPMTVQEFIEEQLIPDPVSMWPKCQKAKDLESASWYCKDPYASVQETLRDGLALVFAAKPVSDWAECQPKKKSVFLFMSSRSPGHPRWYCHEPFVGRHKIYRSLVTFFIDEFLVFVGLICFFDVFVNFFTGELHPENGTLIPKPFFTRWILPGMLLQLLVNPQVKPVGKALGRWLKKVAKLGPVRVSRWIIAVVFPIAYMLLCFLVRWFWLPLVRKQNSEPLKTKPHKIARSGITKSTPISRRASI